MTEQTIKIIYALLESCKSPILSIDSDPIRLRKLERELAINDAKRLLRRYFAGTIFPDQIDLILKQHGE